MLRSIAVICALIFAATAVSAQSSRSAPGFNLPIPNIPGKSITALVVNYPPGGGTPSHHHA
ncbi:MAG: hypothetical protein JSR25_03010, partial [Proteobacteria bacterium]|nr:hypothetical protein [Pseudomonadota bacterium]